MWDGSDVVSVAILYVGLLTLFIWRFAVPWRHAKRWGNWNYITMLYVLVSLLYIFELVMFVMAAMADFKSTQMKQDSHFNSTLSKPDPVAKSAHVNWPVMWLRVLVLAGPAVVFFVIVLCWYQSQQHLQEIRNDVAVDRHDRALNIIATPAVYAVMALSGLLRIYEMVVQEELPGGISTQAKAIADARYETCFFVADLYQAWALYQFGCLTMDLLTSSLGVRDPANTAASTPSSAHAASSASVSRAALVEAVESVMWVGTGMFIVVNLVQSAWSLYLWIFRDPSTDWHHYESLMAQFSYAGLVASAGAIYNVHKVESGLGHYIDGYSPFFKFLSVKLLVFFAFWQTPILELLVLASVLTITDSQLKLLQASMTIIECLGGAVMNQWAWRVREVWYDIPEFADAGIDDEKRPLLEAGAMRA